jgi:type III secretion system FlhB-like substrate exporter
LKIEKASDNTVFIEKDQTITNANTWEELTWDFSEAAKDTYSKVVLFIDFDQQRAGNHQFDDMKQASSASLFPVTFETTSPAFSSFGGASFSVIDNPDASGINTSAKVGEIVKTAGSEKWAGIVTEAPSTLDFSTKKTIKIKVRSSVAGATVRLKIEKASDNTVFIEKDQTITNANTWEELTWDFSEAAKDTYSKVALFIDFGQQRDGNHQFDDMKQE